MRFRYLRDPLFLFCVAIYFVNRWIWEPFFPASFFTDHLNDLICIPFWVPIMLFLLRAMRLRTGDAAPGALEILIPLVLWSVMFEMWLPRTATFSPLATADYRDIFFYTMGALIAAIVWKIRYGAGVSAGGTDPTPRAGERISRKTKACSGHNRCV